jgi:peptide/nickel transport system permease protein
MFRRILQRLALTVVVLVGLSLLTFFVARIIPADPVLLAAGPRASEAQIQQLRERYGYDRPLIEQYLRYMGDLLRGDLGTSVVLRRDVGPDLARFFPATLELVLFALGIAVVFGVPLGLVAAVYRDRLPDQIARVFSLGMVSIPNFWLAIVLQLVLAFTLTILPFTGRFDRLATPPTTITGLYTLDALLTLNLEALAIAVRYLIAPAFCLSLGALATIARTVRADMLDVLGADYIRTARAVGVPMTVLVLKYAFKNASLNTLTQVSLFFGYTLTGSVLVENIFGFPGIGNYAVSAALTKDFVPLMGVTLLTGFAIVTVNVLTDFLYLLLDPRIKYAS